MHLAVYCVPSLFIAKKTASSDDPSTITDKRLFLKDPVVKRSFVLQSPLHHWRVAAAAKKGLIQPSSPKTTRRPPS